MTHEPYHLSDEHLLQDVDGELSSLIEKRVRAHLTACWKCRARRQELEQAITSFVRVHQHGFEDKLPPIEGPRALLKAHLAQLPALKSAGTRWLSWASIAVACAVLVFGLSRTQTSVKAAAVSIPDPKLTPGATLLTSQRSVCAGHSTNNKAVPVALQRKVFEEYGIAGAEPRAYEVDYLVTPALGGADDIHNLWPHSYSATVWNAQVKDDLEERLHEMVCDGRLDLAQAQREIATNWIAAYKKYFHTDQPLTGPSRRRN